MIDSREAFLEMERALSRRTFFKRVLQGAGAIAALDRFGPRLFGQAQTPADMFNNGLQIVSAFGRLVIPVDIPWTSTSARFSTWETTYRSLAICRLSTLSMPFPSLSATDPLS
jgi:hypothetical protein